MSDTDATRREATVGIGNSGCLAAMTDNLLDVAQIKVHYNRERTYTYGDGKWESQIPASATAEIGSLRLTLSPEAWRALIDAVNEVLPQAVTA